LIKSPEYKRKKNAEYYRPGVDDLSYTTAYDAIRTRPLDRLPATIVYLLQSLMDEVSLMESYALLIRNTEQVRILCDILEIFKILDLAPWGYIIVEKSALECDFSL